MYIFNSKFPGGFQANDDDVLNHLKKETQSERALTSSGQGSSRQMCLFLLLLAPLPEGPPLPRIPDLASLSLAPSHHPGLIYHTIVLKSYPVTCRLI